MTFDEWHTERLGGDPYNCPYIAWERFAWNAAIEEAAKTAEAQMEEGECPERAQYCANAIRTLVSGP